MGKIKEASDYLEIIKKLIHSGLSGSLPPNHTPNEYDDLPSMEERTRLILGLANRNKRKATDMLFFVMYDIENDKVRRYIVKYLQRKGCMRVQKSIFLADLDNSIYEGIKKDLAEVQAVYENKDSILVVPISTDQLRAMKIIGLNIDVDIITNKRNTLFF